jgi:hypothetical protein
MSPSAKRILFQLGFVAVACTVIEGCLRFMGYPPGDLRPNWLWFQPVDSLYVIHDFYTNDKGLLVASKEYWSKQKININSDGFRGKEFSELDFTGKKKRLLFIGDSFTWGMSASPFQHNSFCDIIGRDSAFEVINTGIPAADPPQYLKIAETYIPTLKPDFVFVIFFEGNDIMKEDRIVTPGRQFYYWTNAGAILADMDGHHFQTAKEAYDYLSNEKYFLKFPKKWYEVIISKSALLSRLYAGKYRVEEKLNFERLRKNTSLTKKYLTAIKAVADKNGVPLKIVVIPDRKHANMNVDDYREYYSDLLNDKRLKESWLIFENTKQYFRPNPDGHLNNDGHKAYAEKITSFIQSYFRTHNTGNN